MSDNRVDRDKIVAVTMLKWFRARVQSYAGEDLRGHLMKLLDAKNSKADAILAEVAEEIL